MISPEKVQAEALALSPRHRAELVECLLDSLSPCEADSQAEWLSVAKQRLDELKSGEVSGTATETVLRNARSLLAR